MTHGSRRAARRRGARGFTLLELIVVIGIFALVAAMAYGGLISVLGTRNAIEERLDRLADYQKAYWILRDDFQNGVDRPIVGNDGRLRFSLQYDGLDQRVSFTRSGWTNPLDLPRAPLRRVGYFFDSEKHDLMRRTWPVLDRAPQTKPVDTALLEGVRDLRWRFLDVKGHWQDAWPDQSTLYAYQAATTAGLTGTGTSSASQSPPPPIAVELTLETDDWGRLRFLFAYGLQQADQNQRKTPATAPKTPNVFSQPTIGGLP